MLTSGTRFAGYDIVAPLGAGGMGVVYKARDTRLHREVAIKILPAAFATDPERSARFEREAQTLAALNHPHIAQIYGFEDATADGARMRALVMEFVDGEDLAARIARGPIPVNETVAIARQVAEALEAAHEQGIIHRDLKPANIKLRADGTVKVLDFGLAKLGRVEGRSDAEDGGGTVATITSPAVTGRGVILGTAAYMSPEQARGKPVDKRADIWAFGVVLYEMLTGARAFDGETVSDALAAVLTSSPDLSRLPSETPTRVRRLLRRCLDRDPSHRLRDIGEARIALSAPFATPEATSSDTKASAPPTRDRWVGSRVIAALAVATVASVAFAAYAWLRVAASGTRESYELAIGAPRNNQFHIGSNSGNVIISPDGSKVAFVASSGVAGQLWVRSLARDDARPLSGTERASNPFWAPDSRQLGFFANGKLRTVTLDAGLPAVLADAHSGRGGSWSDDGVIIFAPRGGGTLSRVPAAGGAVEQLTKPDLARGENAHYWPQVLPGSKDYIYFVRSTIPENNGIYLGHLDGRAPTRLISSLSSGVYAPPSTAGAAGHLLWVQDGTLVAQSLNIERATLEGPVSTIVDGVRVEESQRAVFASVSNNGILAWADESAAELVLTLFNRAGTRLKTLPIDVGKLVQPEFSPDGKKVAFTAAGRGTADIWIHDIASGASTRVSNTATYEEQPTWSPDGLWVAYNGFAGDDAAVILARVDGSVAPRAALTADIDTKPSFTPDGRALLFVQPRTPRGMALTVAPLADGLMPATVSLDDDLETGNAVWMSPDRRWIAMTALNGPTPEVRAVRILWDASGVKFGGQRITVATNALYPRWSRSGRELFYQAADGYLMAVNVIGEGDGIAFGPPSRLVLLPSDGTGAGGNGWDVSLDGQLVVAVEAPHAAGQTLKVITNWQRRLQNTQHN